MVLTGAITSLRRHEMSLPIASPAIAAAAATRRRLPGAIPVLAMHQLPAEPDALGIAWTEVPLEARQA